MADADPTNALEITVSELSGKLKRSIEDQFGHVRVRGELGRISRPGSGHIYLDLKDERAVLSGIIWRGQAARLQQQPEEGLEVIASGKLTTYPGQSRYQIIIDQLEPAGAGALMALLEERRKKLAAEGLFADERKKALPFMPRRIAVVTSPTGAVIRDILHRLADRFPLHVMVWPVRVQGESCGAEVANGVHQLNNLPLDGPLPRPDLIIVARGGGSLEDLWGFNDEALVRAVAASSIPVISAVGHETDWTLVDHAADWRAPTPTAAAEKAVPVKADLEAFIADLGARLRGAMRRHLDDGRNALRGASRGLPSPDMLLAMPRRRFDEASGRVGRALESRVLQSRSLFGQASARLSPQTLIAQMRAHRQRLDVAQSGQRRAVDALLSRRRERLDATGRLVRLAPIRERIARQQGELTRVSSRLHPRVEDRISRLNERLDRSARLLVTLSYKGVLARGFAVIRDGKGAPLRTLAKAGSGETVSIEMADCARHAVLVPDIASADESPKAPGKTVSPKKPAKPPGQGDLF